MGRDQEWLAFSLYPLSFFLYCPFNIDNNKGNDNDNNNNQDYDDLP